MSEFGLEWILYNTKIIYENVTFVQVLKKYSTLHLELQWNFTFPFYLKWRQQHLNLIAFDLLK
jgi:hypothetical protein